MKEVEKEETEIVYEIVEGVEYTRTITHSLAGSDVSFLCTRNSSNGTNRGKRFVFMPSLQADIKK